MTQIEASRDDRAARDVEIAGRRLKLRYTVNSL